MQLAMTEEAMDYAVRRTGENYMTATGTPFSGDHLNALCRAVARLRLRENITGPTTPQLIERGLTEFEDRLTLREQDAIIVATHEAGHFLVAIFCPHHPPPEKVTIQSDVPWAPFFTQYKHDKHKIGHMRSELLDILCVLYGGIEAERLLLGDISTGASGFGDPRSDLARATELATTLVEACGMSQLPAPLRTFRDQQGRRNILSGTMAEAIDRQINNLLVDAQKRAAAILSRHVDELLAIRAELLEKKTLEGERVRQIIEDLRKRYPEEEISSAYSERKSPDPVGTIRETSAPSITEIVTSPSSQTST
jgi:cell division protease FtsH